MFQSYLSTCLNRQTGRQTNKQKQIDRNVRAIAYTYTQVTGTDAFELWDTYGFPVDLTELMAEERGLSVDKQGTNVLEAHKTCFD